MGREHADIISQTLLHMPEEARKTIAHDLSFTAPEALLWKFGLLFNNWVPNPPTEDWHFHAVAAFTNKPVDEVRKSATPVPPKEDTHADTR